MPGQETKQGLGVYAAFFYSIVEAGPPALKGRAEAEHREGGYRAVVEEKGIEGFGQSITTSGKSRAV